MSRIIEFKLDDGLQVLSWVQTAEELMYWSGRKDFPIENASIFEEWHSDPEIRAYLLEDENEKIGYGEIWFDASDNSVELARLLINPKYRNRGFGRQLVMHLLNQIDGKSYRSVELRLFPENSMAKRCYEKSGFVQVSQDTADEYNRNQPRNYVWMVHEFDRGQQK